jgi:hypothetical protein
MKQLNSNHKEDSKYPQSSTKTKKIKENFTICLPHILPPSVSAANPKVACLQNIEIDAFLKSSDSGNN